MTYTTRIHLVQCALHNIFINLSKYWYIVTSEYLLIKTFDFLEIVIAFIYLVNI